MRKLGVLAIVFVGLLFLMNALGYTAFPIQLLLYEMGTRQKVWSELAALVPVIGSATIGVYMIRSRESFADHLFGEDEHAPTVGVEDLVRSGLLLGGLYLMVQAVPTLVSQVGVAFVNMIQFTAISAGDSFVSGTDMRTMLFRSVPGILATLMSFGIGWFLVARSRYVTGRLVSGPPPDAIVAPRLEHCPNCGAPYDPLDYAGGLSEARCEECKQPIAPSRA